MARLDHIKQRLASWAKWRVRKDAVSLGFPRQAAFLRINVDGGRGGVDTSSQESDAQEIDLAIDALKMVKGMSHLAEVIHEVYLGRNGGGVVRAARVMRKAPSTIDDYLARADRAIASWLDDRAVERERRRSMVSG